MDREMIRDQANALFSKISFVKTSVSDIARACGLGKGTIYLSFKSKDEILLAIIEDRIARIVAANAAFYDDAAIPLRDKVRHFFEDVVDEAFELKDLVFGSFENVHGSMFKDLFFKYGTYFEWCVDRFTEIVHAHPEHSSRPMEDLRKETEPVFELILGRMLLFLVGRDWSDKDGLKTVVGPLSLRLFDAMIA